MSKFASFAETRALFQAVCESVRRRGRFQRFFNQFGHTSPSVGYITQVEDLLEPGAKALQNVLQHRGRAGEHQERAGLLDPGADQ